MIDHSLGHAGLERECLFIVDHEIFQSWAALSILVYVFTFKCVFPYVHTELKNLSPISKCRFELDYKKAVWGSRLKVTVLFWLVLWEKYCREHAGEDS